jgi:MarR family 2-MHQ and catechol resistance regulon transcriptional repressor
VKAKDSGVHVWLVLMKAHRALSRHAERSTRSAEMCFSDFKILELLLSRGPQPVNEIGRRIDLTSGSVTTAVDRLERRGLVERSLDDDDRRARIVGLTRRGEVLIGKVFAEHARGMNDAAAELTVQERRNLVGLLKKLGLSAEQKLGDNAQ